MVLADGLFPERQQALVDGLRHFILLLAEHGVSEAVHGRDQVGVRFAVNGLADHQHVSVGILGFFVRASADVKLTEAVQVGDQRRVKRSLQPRANFQRRVERIDGAFRIFLVEINLCRAAEVVGYLAAVHGECRRVQSAAAFVRLCIGSRNSFHPRRSAQLSVPLRYGTE